MTRQPAARIDNPFRYGDIATGAYFTGREAETAELVADVQAGQNVVVVSPRRFGKTSLVFHAMERLRTNRVLVAYLDLFRTPTKDRFADHLAEAIYDGLVAPHERVLRRGMALFQRLTLQPKVTLNQDGTPSFQFAGSRMPDIDRVIEELLTLPGRVAEQRGRRVALVLDEFQEVLDIDERLPALMRAVFQTQSAVAHVFLGSRRHLMQQVFTERNQPLYKMAKPLVLRPITASVFAAFIRVRCAATGVTIEDAAIERILAVSEGHPHDTQELCYFTWTLAAAGDDVATPDIVERALDDVIEAEGSRYTLLWEDLSAHQRLVVGALVTDPGPVYAEAYREKHRLGPPSTVRRSTDRLVERELVEPTPDGGYRVPDTFLRAWVRRITAPRDPLS